MHKLFLLITVFLILLESTAQTISNYSVSNSTLVSTSEKMPFWLWANTDGKIEQNNSFLNLSQLNASGIHFFNDSNTFIKTGTDLVYAIGNNGNYFQPNQLFTGINLNNWELNIGLYHNKLLFDGLSTTNGNLAKSRNARPYPRISVCVSEFKPVPLLKNSLWFKGEFSEGILNDNRYVSNTHLHSKSLYFKIKPFTDFEIQAGLEHFVMWGGTSRDEEVGELPDNANAYFRYIRGAQGNEDFIIYDQINVAGNQYGTYQLLLTKKFTKFEAKLNISHPFEDLSGMNLRNWPDNLIGLYLKRNNTNKFITHFIYEYTNTRQQSIRDSGFTLINNELHLVPHHSDNYYTNWAYRSGVTFHQKAMSSPLFSPLVIKDGISHGAESTRFFAHHIGLKGKVNNDIVWKSLITFLRHIGNWNNPYGIPKDQTSLLFSFHYLGEQIPFNIELTLAGDISNTYQNNLGVQLGLQYNFLK